MDFLSALQSEWERPAPAPVVSGGGGGLYSTLKKIAVGAPPLRRVLGYQLPGGKVVDKKGRNLRARYDAAQTNHKNAKHWAQADGLSAKTANLLEVRRILRTRARFEDANNSYLKGIKQRIANFTIGTTPRLYMQTNTGNESANTDVEQAFAAWAQACNLGEKLRLMRAERIISGENFLFFFDNPKLENAVHLDLRSVEADQVSTPNLDPLSPTAADGVVFDEWGNPIQYHLLKAHPGDMRFGALEYNSVPARDVIHYFHADRPGQIRGVPEITPSLPLFAMLRDYTLATLESAEWAAGICGVIYTDNPPASGITDDEFEAMDAVQMERGSMMTLPSGYKVAQVKAEQPTGNYKEFKYEILGEIANCLHIPMCFVLLDSSGYNFASGKLDHQAFAKSVRVERSVIENKVLDRIFSTWFREAVLVEGLLPQAARSRTFALKHAWFWDGVEAIDPLKEANATSESIRNKTLTWAAALAVKGLDWREVFDQHAIEQEYAKKKGISLLVPSTQAVVDNSEEAQTQNE